MKIYAVGGYVRDRLLGLTPKDVDYVVVGSSPEEMLSLGFEKVGSSFPVFLHPQTREEYALARTERKTGMGYKGFESSADSTVTLEDDLRRRDLTINAMAMDLSTGEIIDPFNGQEDLKKGILRHTSEAFAEDPVRVLRTARFAARYGFKIVPETLLMMEKISPELNFVPKERIWMEIEKGLMEQYPSLMMKALKECNALNVQAMYPYSRPFWTCLDRIVEQDCLSVRFCLICNVNMSNKEYEEYRVPYNIVRVHKSFIENLSNLLQYDMISLEQRVNLFMRLRIFNEEQSLLDVCLNILSKFNCPNLNNIQIDAEKLKKVSIEKIVQQAASNLEIKQKIFEARVQALQNL